MEGVALVMMETSNNFNDIMRMPVTVYLSIVKHIRMKQLLEIPEWREKYSQEKYKTALKEKRAVLKTTCNIKEISAFGRDL